jgi:alpha-tubulin suppressor-like RCC1 family protein
MRTSTSRHAASRRFPSGLMSLLAAATLVGCKLNVSEPTRSSGSTGSGCFIDCYGPGPGGYEFPTPPFRTTPTAVAGGERFSAISAGWDHACALTPAGSVQCWGELNVGTGEFRNAPSPESVPGGVVFASVSAGGSFTCGVTADARAFCWGLNGSGELGTSGMSPPMNLPTLVSGGHAFAGIAPGVGRISAGAHACARDTAGAAYCWGNNAFGQLGTGDTVSASAPVAVAGGHMFTSMASGNAFTCGVTTDGAAYCWGFGESGALGAPALGSCTGKLAGSGDANLTYPCSRAPVRVAGSVVFTAVAAGMRHACGLADDGTAYCWGTTGWGNSSEPVAVVGQTARFTRIAAEGTSSCALTADGEAYCWGENSKGQVGDGTTYDRGPTRVATSLRFVDISVGHDFACAVTTEGAAYCWGSDEYGKLGDGE